MLPRSPLRQRPRIFGVILEDFWRRYRPQIEEAVRAAPPSPFLPPEPSPFLPPGPPQAFPQHYFERTTPHKPVEQSKPLPTRKASSHEQTLRDLRLDPLPELPAINATPIPEEYRERHKPQNKLEPPKPPIPAQPERKVSNEPIPVPELPPEKPKRPPLDLKALYPPLRPVEELPPRGVEPEHKPPTFEEVLNQPPPPLHINPELVRRPAAEHKDLPEIPLDFPEVSAIHRGLADAEDERDTASVIDALPDAAVIHAQRLIAEAQDMRDINAFLSTLD